MRKLLSLLFALLVLAGCGKSKKEDPTPTSTSAAEAVAGLYTMSSLTSGGKTIPLPFSNNGNSISGTINVVAVSGKQDEVNLTLTLKVTGSPDGVVAGDVQVKAAGNGYQLLDSGQQIGTVDGNTLTLTDGSNTYVAKK